jgi:enamine deaminase RidA (YjgF/YER057c/UK114 family)
MERLGKLGLVLPEPPAVGGAYVPTRIAGSLLAIAGQFPLRDGRPQYAGRIGAELTIEQGYAAARLAALNVLAHIHAALGGFERLRGLIRVDGHLLTAPDFSAHPRVLNGASELFNAVLGERGRHARTVFGQASDAAVEYADRTGRARGGVNVSAAR